MATDSASPREQHISVDRETVRKWADKHDAVPVREGSDGPLDLVPESKVTVEDERLAWDTFYDGLDSEDHVVIYHGDASETPFEVMAREQAVTRSDVEAEQFRDRLVEGETVTSTIKETTVVETVVVEEATLESELAGREVTGEELLDVELVEREQTGCKIVASADVEDSETFDRDRYFASLEASRGERTEADATQADVERSLPYTAEIDIREVWAVSREFTERFTVESRITETDVAEAESVEDYDLDVEGLQRSIVEQGMLDVDHTPDEVMTEFDIESELGEGDQIYTYFTRVSVVEDEVVDQIRAYADNLHTDRAEMDIAAADHVVSQTDTETMDLGTEHASLTSDDVGKSVMDATGSEVGTVEEITEGGQTASVEPHSSITERIMSTFHGDDEDESAIEIHAGQVAHVTDKEIQLKEYEQLDKHREAHGSD